MVALACRAGKGQRSTTIARSAGSAPDFAPPSAGPGVVAGDSEVGCRPLGVKQPARLSAVPRNLIPNIGAKIIHSFAVRIISSMMRRADSESVGHAVIKAAKRGSASTAALSAALYDATSDFPDDSDGCSSPTGGASHASPQVGSSELVLATKRFFVP